MSWVIKCWCSDCTENDEMGCNDGYHWYAKDDRFNRLEFDTKAEAMVYIDDELADYDSPWHAAPVEVKP